MRFFTTIPRCFFGGVILALAACASPSSGPDRIALSPASFDDLDGWQDDRAALALDAFLHSCQALSRKAPDTRMGIGGTLAAWQAVCADVSDVAENDEAARTFFEKDFALYAVSGVAGADGFFTGYYVPQMRGALIQGGAFQTPLYGRPQDMISADLGAFRAELKGQKIYGKLAGATLVPYDSRADIAAGALQGRADPLVWVDSPVSAFFMEVQGSGRVKLPDGHVLSLGYDASNGRAYVALGRVLADRGAIDKPVTMPKIKAWLEAHPEDAQDAMNANPSYVFFRLLPDDKIVGAQGAQLTEGRSLAVDPAFIPMGAPLWLETADGKGEAFHHLMVAQDTGGAIKGVVRGDVFWGAGDAAADQAGAMQSRGKYYILLPKGAVRDE